MIKEIIAQGKDVAEAKENARAALGVSEIDDVKFEVLHMGSRGISLPRFPGRVILLGTCVACKPCRLVFFQNFHGRGFKFDFQSQKRRHRRSGR